MPKYGLNEVKNGAYTKMTTLSPAAKRNITLLVLATLITIIVVASAALYSLGQNQTADNSNLNEARVDELIERYLDKNIPQLHQKLVAYVEDQQRQRQVQQTEDAFSNPQPLLIRDHNPITGPENAAITIVDYSEFQCPFCARSRGTLETLKKRYEGKVRFVFKNYPLPFHEEAVPAGKAAYAAHQQGKFWAFHDKLFANQQNLSDAFYLDVAKDLGLNIDQFNTDRNSTAAEKAIEQDTQDGAQVGVRGTPFFLINGVPLSGAQPVSAFKRIIERLLAEGK